MNVVKRYNSAQSAEDVSRQCQGVVSRSAHCACPPHTGRWRGLLILRGTGLRAAQPLNDKEARCCRDVTSWTAVLSSALA